MEASTILLPVHTRLSGRRLRQFHRGIWWLWWWPQYEGQCASTSKASQGYKQIIHIRCNQIRWKNNHFLSNGINKHALIQLISGCLREKGCHTVQADGDADLAIVKVAVAMSAYKSTTLTGEYTDLLVLLLYHAATNDCKDLNFWSHKGKPNV